VTTATIFRHQMTCRQKLVIVTFGMPSSEGVVERRIPADVWRVAIVVILG